MSNEPQSKTVRTKDGRRSRPSLPVWKKALFASLAFVLFFGLLEVVLLLFGVKPLSYAEDPYVAFASRMPLFVEAEGDGAQMETAGDKWRFFNRQRFMRRKAGRRHAGVLCGRLDHLRSPV